jgi:hypothetical protein
MTVTQGASADGSIARSKQSVIDRVRHGQHDACHRGEEISGAGRWRRRQRAQVRARGGAGRHGRLNQIVLSEVPMIRVPSREESSS